MSSTPLRILSSSLLMLALACDAQNEPPKEEADDEINADDSDDDTGDDDTDPPPTTGKVDAGNVDAGTKKDAGGKVDASTPKSDAGESKGDAGTSVSTSPDASTDVPSDRPKPKCMKKDSQLIMIGDSYMSWPITHTFPEDMQAESGQKWRMEAVGGYSMATGGLGLIPPLFDASIKRDADAHTVLMDGGGNDILLGDVLRECRDEKAPTVANCKKLVNDAIAASEKLMQRMVTAGIRDVVYYFYPHVPQNTALGGPNPNYILDYSLPLVRDFCESREDVSGGKIRCTFVDMVPVFDGKPESEWFFPGDIHPTSTGSKAMAKKVWEVMTEKCIAQKDPKDCCES